MPEHLPAAAAWDGGPVSQVLADHSDLRQRLITAIVPQALRSTVEHSLASLPTSTIPFVAGLIGLLFSGTGVVFSVVLAMLLLGALATRALTVAATTLPGQPAGQRAAAVLRSALVVFAVPLLGAKVLLARPAPVRAPGGLAGLRLPLPLAPGVAVSVAARRGRRGCSVGDLLPGWYGTPHDRFPGTFRPR
jgi:membrane protein